MRTYLILTAVVLMSILMGCVPPAAPPTFAPTVPETTTPLPLPTSTPQPMPTPTPLAPAAVVMEAAERYNAGDLEGGLAYWADDAIWYLFGMPPTGNEILVGKQAIREVLEENIASHSRWEVEIATVVGDVVSSRSKNWHDFTRQLGVAPLEATGVYLIRDGKIASYAWTLTQESASRLKTAIAAAMPVETAAVPQVAGEGEEPVSALTVTIAGGTCSYDGPMTLDSGEVHVTVDVQDLDRESYTATFISLDPGKDIIDLMAATTGLPPSWAHVLHYEEALPGTSKSYDISVTDGPLYAVCWSKPPEQPIGNLGPFTVVPAGADSAPTEVPTTSAAIDSDLVVAFAVGHCQVDNPPSLQAGAITVTMDLADATAGDYALTLFHLEPGRSIGELAKSQSQPSPPNWADMISMGEAMAGEKKTYSALIEARPLYLLCWGGSGEGRVIGWYGPIDVSE